MKNYFRPLGWKRTLLMFALFGVLSYVTSMLFLRFTDLMVFIAYIPFGGILFSVLPFLIAYVLAHMIVAKIMPRKDPAYPVSTAAPVQEFAPDPMRAGRRALGRTLFTILYAFVIPVVGASGLMWLGKETIDPRGDIASYLIYVVPPIVFFAAMHMLLAPLSRHAAQEEVQHEEGQ